MLRRAPHLVLAVVLAHVAGLARLGLARLLLREEVAGVAGVALADAAVGVRPSDGVAASQATFCTAGGGREHGDGADRRLAERVLARGELLDLLRVALPADLGRRALRLRGVVLRLVLAAVADLAARRASPPWRACCRPTARRRQGGAGGGTRRSPVGRRARDRAGRDAAGRVLRAAGPCRSTLAAATTATAAAPTHRIVRIGASLRRPSPGDGWSIAPAARGRTWGNPTIGEECGPLSARGTVASRDPAEPVPAIRLPWVRAFAVGASSPSSGMQTLLVAVGWQLYERTGSAWALGLVGVFELIPVLLLFVPVGHLVDRSPRRRIAMFAHALLGLASLGFLATTAADAPLWWTWALLLVVGVARAFAAPSVGTILPQLLDPLQFAHANAWMSAAFQVASVAGPVAGGALIDATGDARAAFVAGAVGQAVFLLCLLRVPKPPVPPVGGRARPRRAVRGLLVRARTPVFLAAITLDLFAVLLGGATALLPMFAKDVLHVGATELGGCAPRRASAPSSRRSRSRGWRRGSGRAGCCSRRGRVRPRHRRLRVSRHLWLSLGCLVPHGALRRRERRRAHDARADGDARRAPRARGGGEVRVHRDVNELGGLRERALAALARRSRGVSARQARWSSSLGGGAPPGRNWRGSARSRPCGPPTTAPRRRPCRRRHDRGRRDQRPSSRAAAASRAAATSGTAWGRWPESTHQRRPDFQRQARRRRSPFTRALRDPDRAQASASPRARRPPPGGPRARRRRRSPSS